MNGPLSGIRVLELTGFMQGPVACSMLGDLGADVIKIESRTGDPIRGITRWTGVPVTMPQGRNFFFEHHNRNKRSLTVDLKRPEGRDIVYRLVERSDVFVQAFRRRAARSLGMDYETLSRHNPRLIYASASASGPKGPDNEEAGFDYTALARSGMMTALGEPGMPPLAPLPGYADQMGATTLAYGILAALVARERLGIGQELDVSLLGSMVHLQRLMVSAAFMLGTEFPKHERARAYNPLWNHYRCRDDKWLAVAMAEPDKFWHGFCQALSMGHLERDAKYQYARRREENCAELIAILDGIFATRGRQEWLDILKGHGVIATPVNSFLDLVNDPQLTANDYVISYDHPVLGRVTTGGFPVQFGKTPASVRMAPPALGQHNEEVLLDVAGYSREEVAAFKEKKVI